MNHSKTLGSIATLAGLAGVLLTATSAQAATIAVNNGDFTSAMSVINSNGIQNLGLATTGAWFSGKNSTTVWTHDAVNGLAEVDNIGNGIALFQVIEVGGAVSSSSDWTFSFDLASTVGAVVGDDIAVGIYTWRAGVDTAPTIDLADSSVGAIYSLGAQNGANAELNSDTRHDFFFDEGRVIANEGGLAVNADSGTYSFDFTLDALDDRVAIIFSGRHRSTDNPDAFSIDNVGITAVPEPSSLALIGLASLGLVLRRRRS